MIIKNIHKNVLAKTQTINDKTVDGISVFAHTLIVGVVCEELIKVLPKDVIEKYDLKNFPFFASIHDIGKASPGFQEMLNFYCGKSKFKTFDEIEQKFSTRHEQISCKYLEKYKSDIFDNCDLLLKVIEYHHGYIRENKASDWGDVSIWNDVRNDIYKELNSIFPFETIYVERNDKNFDCANDYSFKFLAGLLGVSDWIGSNEEIFQPKDFMGDFLNTNLIRELAKNAIGSFGFDEPIYNTDLSFKDLFNFEPNPVQKMLSDSITGPGVYVVEAPMGNGKTEAAEYAAYIAIQKGIANGVYFALPTQTTSNLIFKRYKDFVQKISNVSENDIRLTHSKSSFHESMCGMHSWFEGKRSILSKFALGTIDQAIMSVVPDYRHFFIRTFGLNKKVVILDEVHSYDVYTSNLMKQLIDDLVSMDCVVILLSATLTTSAKYNLCGDDTKISAYPLITKVSKDYISHTQLKTKDITKNIKINLVYVNNQKDRKNFISSRLDEINKCLKLIEDGKMILWIENTVKDSQEVFSFFQQKKIKCGLLHSKFTTKDRNDNETYWMNVYGKDSSRECGCVLVGTQVCEQSLDIDADYLVTAICPTDMLCQRLGRLHRHKRENRNAPECTILSDILYETDESKDVFSFKQKIGTNAFVYSPYILRKSHFIWKDKKQISFPNDIRCLLEKTYEENESEDNLNIILKKDLDAKKKRQKENSINAMNTKGVSRKSDSGEVDVDEDFYSTRDITIRTLDVILCKEFSETNFTTINDKQIKMSNRFSTKDIQDMNESTLKIASDLIIKESNIFRKIKFGKYERIFCIVNNENVLNFSERSPSGFFYSRDRGFFQKAP